MAPSTKASTDGPIQKRLHIGGLTNPKITHADLEKRFTTFGEVEGVEGVGKDANGQSYSSSHGGLCTMHIGG